MKKIVINGIYYNFYKTIFKQNDIEYSIYKDNLNKLYFVKIVTNDEDKIKLLENEYLILKHLLSDLYSCSYIKIDNSHILVQEYYVGQSLQMKNDLNFKESILIFKSICEQVQKIHKHNVIHCDLKPGNIIVSNINEIHIIDFGIAQIINDERKNEYATIRYCSPEQIKKERLDERTDIYSLGLILYEMVNKIKPFEDINSKEIKNIKLEEDKYDLKENVEIMIPDNVKKIYHKAIIFDRDKRYKNIEELICDLDKIILSIKE